MDLRLFSHDLLPDIQLFTYDIITLFHWFLVVQQFCNSAIFDFFDVFENCGLTEIFKVEKSGLNQKEKESSLLTFLESHRGWEMFIKMVLKNSVLWIVFVLFVIFVFHARPSNFFFNFSIFFRIIFCLNKSRFYFCKLPLWLISWLRWHFFPLKISEKAEQLDEEKEAFDDAEKGKLAGETEKSKTPDKKPITAETETKNEDAENKEEKKSNGAHTPVWISSKNTVRLIYRQLKNLESRVGENQWILNTCVWKRRKKVYRKNSHSLVYQSFKTNTVG